MRNKKILLILIAMTCSVLIGCSSNNVNKTKYFDAETISDGFLQWIIVDKNTGVMYIKHNNGMSPIYNADGTLKIYEEGE